MLSQAKRFSRKSVALIAALTAASGIFVVIYTFAAGAPLAFEAENAALTGPAAVVAQTGASGTGVVKFGSGASDPLSSLITTAAPAGSGSLSPLLSLNSHYTNYPAGLDAAKAAGFGWIRKDINWSDVEKTKGVYDFSAYDNMLAQLTARGLKPLWILVYGNTLYTQNSMSVRTAAERTAFGNFAEAAARHFAGNGVRYEVYNEPDGSTMWLPEPNASEFAALAQSTLPRIRTGDPRAKVTTGGLGMFDRPYFPPMLAAGAATGYDAVAVHTYWMPGDPETVFGELAWWRSVKAQYGVTAEDWMTEFGYGITGDWGGGEMNGDATKYAAWTARLILSDWAAGFKFINLYDTDDRGQGLLNTANKKGLDAITTLSSVAKDRTFTGYTIPTNNSTQLNALRLEGPADFTYALWMRSGSQTVQLPAGATAIDMLGAPVTLAVSGSQLSLTLSAAQGPVYVKLLK
jgi:hypothetical protein